MPNPIVLNGAPGSPYTRKMLALLRYRRLPYAFLQYGLHGAPGLPPPRVPLLPTFYLPGKGGKLEAVTDSTPIIRRLEREHAGRAAVPPGPAAAFVDALLEDYGDEWLTKAMFHYRWRYAPDIDKAGEILPRWSRINVPDEEIAALKQAFSERQIGRLGVVGSNDVTGPVIEDGYRRFLALFDAHLRRHPFLMGARPGAGDFAVFGQLTQLVRFDPTPGAIALESAPRVVAWCEVCEDLSGLEPKDEDWLDLADPPQTLRDLLAEVGRVYAPLLLANASALEAMRETFEVEVDGRPWAQHVFPYQAKCLRALREAYGALAPAERTRVERILSGTGCEALFG